MALIIAGHFDTKTQADVAVAAISSYVGADDISLFHNNPPGQHDMLPAGGDEVVDPGSEGAAEQAGTTALAAGLTAGAVGMAGGPLVAVAAAGIAAYTGSLVGALDGLGEDAQTPETAQRRQAGVILAIRIGRPEDEEKVISALRVSGAEDIERTQGTWRDGDWVDFDPLKVPQHVAA